MTSMQWIGALLAWALTALPTTAAASTRLPPVEVARPALGLALGTRTDVQNACPELEKDLQRALAGPHAHYRRRGQAEVLMRIGADQDVRLLSLDGPAVYQRSLRRVVSGLNCRAHDVPTTYGFAVRFH